MGPAQNSFRLNVKALLPQLFCHFQCHFSPIFVKCQWITWFLVQILKILNYIYPYFLINRIVISKMLHMELPSCLSHEYSVSVIFRAKKHIYLEQHYVYFVTKSNADVLVPDLNHRSTLTRMRGLGQTTYILVYIWGWVNQQVILSSANSQS